MNKPKISLEIKKQGNIVVGISAFLGLGIAGTSAITLSPIATLMLCGGMIPLALDIIGLKLLIEKPDPESIIQRTGWIHKPFRKKLDKWIVNYINESESITEKKYKVGYLSIWMNNEGINLDKVCTKKTYKYLLDLSNELVDSKETHKLVPFSYFFGNSKGSIKEIYGVEPSIKTFLEEDKNSEEKIRIAKDLYKEYSQIGLAAKEFVNRGEYDELLILQDYRLTSQDYNVIEAYTENVKKEGIPNGRRISTTLFSDEAKQTISKIIDRENNVDNLKRLGNYCLCLRIGTGFEPPSERKKFEPLALLAEKKIEYLKLDTELEVKVKDVGDKPKAKRLKV